jgi:hypothetical protein
LRPAAPVHQHDGGAANGDQRQQAGIVLQCRHVVHDTRAGIETGPRHGGAPRVDRDHDIAPGQALDHGQHALQLFGGLDRPRAGSCRLSPDIDDVGALRNETQAIVDGLRGRGVSPPSVNESGRHIDVAMILGRSERTPGKASRQHSRLRLGIGARRGPAPGRS